MNDYDYVVLKLVQTAERYPDRVGCRGTWMQGESTCFVGEAGGVSEFGFVWRDRRFNHIRYYDPKAATLIAYAIGLNDRGMPWGQIVKELGLVPDELKEEVTDEVAAPVADVPELLCTG